MVSLIDTNVIIRFLAADVIEQHEESVVIFNRVQNKEIEVEILGEVIIEVLYVMTKQYKEPIAEIAHYIKQLLRLKGVVNKDKYVLIEALNKMVKNKIDFVDALICAKSSMQGYGKISFDKDITNKCE